MVSSFSLRVNTRTAYASLLRQYQHYIHALSLPSDRPVTERQLCAIALLYVRTHKTTSLPSFMSAVQSHYTNREWGALPRGELYKKLVRGWNNMVGPIDEVKPKVAFTETQLKSIHSYLPPSTPTFTQTRNWCMYLLSFYGLLRVSEVHRLCWSDIVVTANYVGVRVPYSKTSLTPVTIKLFVRGDWACPKKALQQYESAIQAAIPNSKLWPKGSQPLFVANAKSVVVAVTVEQSQMQLKATIAQALGLELTASDYAWHSFRRGGTTALINAGVPDSIVQAHGRWRSDCYLRYYDTVNVHTLLPTQMLHLHSSTALTAAANLKTPSPGSLPYSLTAATSGRNGKTSSWHDQLPLSK